jgi:S1-C subfamily serine protease
MTADPSLLERHGASVANACVGIKPSHEPWCLIYGNRDRLLIEPGRQKSYGPQSTDKLSDGLLRPESLRTLHLKRRGVVAMKSSIVLIGLVLLGGCTAAEPSILAFASDGVRKRATQREARPTSKITKQSHTQGPPQRGGASKTAFPAWSVPSPKPSTVLRSPLTPIELFIKVSPAVYALAAEGHPPRQLTSQGSAVAVSSKEAITNCHIVVNAKSIILANAARSLRAEVVSADPSTDRCYLRVPEGELDPVAGIRDYTTLAVGEVVFTVGSPRGLVNTLGSGLLSGLRKSEGEPQYIQITAPVSEGSSGGGLFDERGNLIGVTSFTVRDSQNLNFAIAVSEFWR